MTYEELRNGFVQDLNENAYLNSWYGKDGLELTIKALEKQIPKPPKLKKHPENPEIGEFYFCECGAMFPFWGNPRGESNYCGICGQKLKGGI